MKAKATVYKGIEFIQVGALPADQQLLLKHAQDPERINILLDGKILRDCIQYRHYSEWYSMVYESSVVSVAPQMMPESPIALKISA